MDTNNIKAEVEKGIQKLEQLRDEVKLKLHLASLEAKTEWDEAISPRVLEAQDSAKALTETSRTAVNDVVRKVEDFLGRIKKDAPPHSVH